jgi:hypothetical protein
VPRSEFCAAGGSTKSPAVTNDSKTQSFTDLVLGGNAVAVPRVSAIEASEYRLKHLSFELGYFKVRGFWQLMDHRTSNLYAFYWWLEFGLQHWINHTCFSHHVSRVGFLSHCAGPT